MNLKQPYEQSMRMAKSNPNLDKLCEIIRQHIGEENAISKDALSIAIFGEPANEKTERALRKMRLPALLRGVVIGTNNDDGGYFHISKGEKGSKERDSVIQSLYRSRIISLSEEERVFTQKANEWLGDNYQLPIESAPMQAQEKPVVKQRSSMFW